jgi:hypothetical protein
MLTRPTTPLSSTNINYDARVVCRLGHLDDRHRRYRTKLAISVAVGGVGSETFSASGWEVRRLAATKTAMDSRMQKDGELRLPKIMPNQDDQNSHGFTYTKTIARSG